MEEQKQQRAHAEDFTLLGERVSQLIKDEKISHASKAPIYLLLAHKFYADDDSIHDSFTDGANDCGVDAIYIERSLNQPRVHIIQSKYYESERKSRNCYKASTLEKIHRFLEIIKDTSLDLDRICNPALVQKIYEIRDLQKRDFPELKVWLVSNGSPCSEAEVRPLTNALNRKSIEVEQFHLLELVEFCIKRRSSRTEHVFHVRDIGVLEHGHSILRGLVAFISARELYNLIKDIRNERKIDYTLFDMNVRGFLGSHTAVNQEIFRTADSTENRFFASFNNGITIVGTDFKVMATSDQPKIGVKNLNIVNGAQTCSAIFDAMAQHYPDTSRFRDLSVLIRVFATDDRDLIGRIALSSNSQNRINPRDLKANEKEQIQLEKDLLERGIQYVRKRGLYEEFPSELVELDALKAGQIALAYIHLEPAQAKRDSDDIFLDTYGKIFYNLNLDKLVDGFRLYQRISKKRAEIEENIRIKGVMRTENTFVTYGSFHILTMCAVGKIIHPNATDDELIDLAIENISKVLIQLDSPAYYSFFRNPAYTKLLIDEMQQPSLFE
ncbi:AIPR family protein [Oricola sp.]|uniref:AIPR family protein n=1 Tax=Oricola sp. TaxID=1979950 RepID=UPI0025DC28B7|nr:AIPR family protein [Oricola sp.]MCI5076391.1 AIPR family protein [Oricola sp.]